MMTVSGPTTRWPAGRARRTMAPAVAPVISPKARPASRARIGFHLLAATVAARTPVITQVR